MTAAPQNEEPGFEQDVNELPDDQRSTFEHSTEKQPSNDRRDLEKVQEDAAHEREEKGGYQ